MKEPITISTFVRVLPRYFQPDCDYIQQDLSRRLADELLTHARKEPVIVSYKVDEKKVSLPGSDAVDHYAVHHTVTLMPFAHWAVEYLQVPVDPWMVEHRLPSSRFIDIPLSEATSRYVSCHSTHPTLKPAESERRYTRNDIENAYSDGLNNNPLNVP